MSDAAPANIPSFKDKFYYRDRDTGRVWRRDRTMEECLLALPPVVRTKEVFYGNVGALPEELGQAWRLSSVTEHLSVRLRGVDRAFD